MGKMLARIKVEGQRMNSPLLCLPTQTTQQEHTQTEATGGNSGKNQDKEMMNMEVGTAMVGSRRWCRDRSWMPCQEGRNCSRACDSHENNRLGNENDVMIIISSFIRR